VLQVIYDNTQRAALTAAMRKIFAKVELYSGSTLVDTFSYTDKLISFTVERAGESSKFFGFGVGHKVNIKLLDSLRDLYITTADTFKVYLAAGEGGYIEPFSSFYVTEVNRDENTNALSITAYDVINKLQQHTLNEIELPEVYTLNEFVGYIGAFLGISISVCDLWEFNASAANFDGTETLREVLDDIAELTTSVYYAYADTIYFKRLDRDGEPALRISKNDYYTLDSKTNRRLTSITHATELGDNITASNGAIGTEQIMRDNAFLALLEDAAAMLEYSVEQVGGLTINQFELDWRGNFLLQIGDKLEIETKDGGSVIAYLLDDSLTYDGGLHAKTRWSYEEGESADSNPTNLGEALKQTFARVDKANKKVDIVVRETAANTAALASLRLDTDSINATVEKLESATTEAVDGLSESVADLKQSVEASVTAEDVTIAIKEELSNGVDKVETATGFKFDESGLEVSKSNSEMSTKITEDGMTVAKSGEVMLTANNQGVNAQNLHATTYLIVGNSSRFEDYEKNGELRTGCFWIGGAS
jgi:uncharacterized protein YoxC